MAAKNDRAHLSLARQLRARQVLRIYRAIAYGFVEPEKGIIALPIGRHPTQRVRVAVRPDGRPAITHSQVLEYLPGPPRCTFLQLRLETGRTHQIRVHLSHQGFPLVDDPVHAPGRPALGLGRQALHTAELGFEHPVTGEWLPFRSPCPRRWRPSWSACGVGRGEASPARPGLGRREPAGSHAPPPGQRCRSRLYSPQTGSFKLVQ